MIPILYDNTRKVWPDDFRDNGLGALAHALKCEVSEERNGPFELEMEYAAWGDLANELKEQRLILAKPNNRDELHLFRIYSVVKKLEEGKIVVSAYSRTNDLGNSLVGSIDKIDQKDPQLVLDMLKANVKNPVPYPYTLTTDMKPRELKVDMSKYKYRNVLECIVGSEGSLIHHFGGEVRRTNNGIEVLGQRGYDRGDVLRPGKNLDDFNMTVDTKGLVTAILPYSKWTETIDNSSKQVEHMIEGDMIKSGHADEYPILYFQAVDFSNEKIKKDDKDEDIKSKDELMNHKAVKQWFKAHEGIDRPNVTVDIKMRQFSETSEVAKLNLKLIEDIGLCDYVYIYVPLFKEDVRMKVSKYRYDVLEESCIELTAGAQRSSLFEKATTENNNLTELKDYVAQTTSSLREYVTEASNGVNKVYYTSHLPEGTNHRVGDIVWHQENSGSTQLYIWDGNAWVAEHRDNSQEIINEKVKEALANAKQAFVADAKQDMKKVEDEVKMTLNDAISNAQANTNALTARLSSVEGENTVRFSQISNKLGEIENKVLSSDGFRTNLVSVLQNDKGIVTNIVNNMMIGGSKNLIVQPDKFDYFSIDNVVVISGESNDLTIPFRKSVNPRYVELEFAHKAKDLVNGFGDNPYNSYLSYNSGFDLQLKKALEVGKKYTLYYHLYREPHIIAGVKNLFFNTTDKAYMTSFGRLQKQGTWVYDADKKTSGYVIRYTQEELNKPEAVHDITGVYYKLNDALPEGEYRLSFATKGINDGIRVDFLDAQTRNYKNEVHTTPAISNNTGFHFTEYNFTVTPEMAGKIAYVRILFKHPISTVQVIGYTVLCKKEDVNKYPISSEGPNAWTPGVDDYNNPKVAAHWSRDAIPSSGGKVMVGSIPINSGADDAITFTAFPEMAKDILKVRFPATNENFKIWNWILVEGEMSKDEIINNDIDGMQSPLSQLIERKMSNSWAVSHINGAGDIVSEINLNKDGVRIKGQHILLDGDVAVNGTAFLDGAVIKDGSIGTAQIANASIDSARIKDLDANKITGFEARVGTVVTQDLITDRLRAAKSIQIGDDTMMYIENNLLKIQKGTSNNVYKAIEVSGRIVGPTWFHGGPSRNKYVPVMTNSGYEDGIEGKNGYPYVYGVRWMGVVSWSSGVYLHIDDGTKNNHHFYIKLTPAESQTPLEDGLVG